MRRRNVKQSGEGPQKRTSSRRNGPTSDSQDGEERIVHKKARKSTVRPSATPLEVDLQSVVASLGMRDSSLVSNVTTKAASKRPPGVRKPATKLKAVRRTVPSPQAALVLNVRAEQTTADIRPPPAADSPPPVAPIRVEQRAADDAPRRHAEADGDTEKEDTPTAAILGFTALHRHDKPATGSRHKSLSRSSSTKDEACKWLRQNEYSRGRFGSGKPARSLSSGHSNAQSKAMQDARPATTRPLSPPSQPQKPPPPPPLLDRPSSVDASHRYEEPPQSPVSLLRIDTVDENMHTVQLPGLEEILRRATSPPSTTVAALFEGAALVDPVVPTNEVSTGRNGFALGEDTGEGVGRPSSPAPPAPQQPPPPHVPVIVQPAAVMPPPPPAHAYVPPPHGPHGGAMWTGPVVEYGTGAFVSSTTRHRERANYYADKGKWLKVEHLCARCGVFFSEGTSVGRWLCFAHQYATPVSPAYGFACCGMLTAGLATPMWRIAEVGKGRGPFQVGCMPVDHITRDELHSLRKDSIANVLTAPTDPPVICLTLPAEGIQLAATVTGDPKYPDDPAVVYVRKKLIPA